MKIANAPKIHQGFHRIGSRYGHLFDRERFLKRSLWDGNRLTPDSHPYANIKIGTNYHKIEIAVPGFKKGELSVHLNGNLLTIEGQKETSKMKQSKYIRQEYSLDRFKKVFTLTSEVDKANIKPNYANGVLTIQLHYLPEMANKIIRKDIPIY